LKRLAKRGERVEGTTERHTGGIDRRRSRCEPHLPRGDEILLDEAADLVPQLHNEQAMGARRTGLVSPLDGTTPANEI
jgi:hypothetical protein